MLKPGALWGASADRQVGDCERYACNDERTDLIVEVGRDAYSIREVLQGRTESDEEHFGTISREYTQDGEFPSKHLRPARSSFSTRGITRKSDIAKAASCMRLATQ